MRLTIDNLDGTGPLDYSAALSADPPLKIDRVLNQLSRCTGALVLAGAANRTGCRTGRSRAGRSRLPHRLHRAQR